MLKKLLIGFTLLVVALAVGLSVFISSRPDTFVVQRSITIKSPPAPIYPLIADFHKWTKWSPYEKMDPRMERKYEGTESGTGAKYVWEGNEKAGSGTMQITEATPPSKVVIKLDFSKPFEGHNVAEFKLEPHGDGRNSGYLVDERTKLGDDESRRYVYEYGSDDWKRLRSWIGQFEIGC